MDFASLSAAVSGRAIGPGLGQPGFTSVCIDSRKAKPGSLFVALAGSVQDGHRYVEAAFKAGASCALVECSKLEDPALGLNETVQRYGRVLIAVKDSLRALQDAAAAYLEKFPNLVKIGITGSSGKTTTKEIAAAIIGEEMATVMNPLNLNSETGLPLAVFEVRDFHRAGIFELGMNRRHEIAELAGILKPHIALVTNIGLSHIGKIGSCRGIALEKKWIFYYQKETDYALIPADCEFREVLAEGLKGTLRFYGPENLEGLGPVRDLGLSGAEIVWAGEKVHFRLPGKHNLADAVAAIAIAREMGAGDAAIRRGLESVRPLFGRSEIFTGDMTVVRDCYNANPESTAAAIEFCDALEYPGRKVYVLGSMLELGDASRAAHRDLALALTRSAADMVFLYGSEMEQAAAVLSENSGAAAERKPIRFFHTNDMDELSSGLTGYLEPGDLVLVKGSRGCALERLDPVLLGGTGQGGEKCS
ncbi:MAG: UDP-N-acetylmuramoyl-tripeptide--D-alanyl-D-alanine ligase [Treponema sp.]|jgi:UDP-N-acetylmuramoyl-tripeptide--D-alanyl-D-alanine ligase|nr:UDP-N-acetylmuramoyl-tripeptide--D-alanyl-D-alanine ligase [Treponema sp.]